jgi:hypothetical protein
MRDAKTVMSQFNVASWTTPAPVQADIQQISEQYRCQGKRDGLVSS